MQEMVELLREHGATWKVPELYYFAAPKVLSHLGIAAARGMVGMVELLLKHEEAREGLKDDSLEAAAHNGHTAVSTAHMGLSLP